MGVCVGNLVARSVGFAFGKNGCISQQCFGVFSYKNDTFILGAPFLGLFQIPGANIFGRLSPLVQRRLKCLQLARKLNDLRFIAVAVLPDSEAAGYAASSCHTAASGLASPGLSLALCLNRVEQ